MLHRRGMGAGADFVEEDGAVLALGLCADLDESVRGQCQVDLGHDRGAQALVADQYHRVELVGERPQGAALGRG